MSTPLKIKYLITGVSLVLLVLVSLYKLNFLKEDQMIRYRDLTWDDFKGIPKPFTGWGAGIESDVFIEFDSTLNRFKAYAAMNSTSSWKKRNNLSEYLLNHEQYHFNLTQYYALKLNSELEETDGLKEAFTKLNNIRVDLDKAQNKYDLESEHNLNQDFQNYWEFKIDSLLTSVDSEKSTIRKDLYAGVQFFNLRGLKKTKLYTENGSFQSSYETSFSRAGFAISSIIRKESSHTFDLQESVNAFYQKDSLESVVFLASEQGQYQTLIAESSDSLSGLYFYDKWIGDGKSLHLLRLQVDSAKPKSGYKLLFNSISSTFETASYTEDWGLIANQENYIESPVEDYDASSHNSCMIIDESQTPGFIPYLLTTEQQDLIIPYTPVVHSDSLIADLTLVYGDYQVVQSMSDSVVFKIPKERLTSKFQVLIGYTLKSDTINECSTFLNQSLVLTK